MSGMNTHDITIRNIDSYLLPVKMRMPLKFGSESIDSVTCLRVAVSAVTRDGRGGVGWGETPLSVTWAWPSQTLSYSHRYDVMIEAAKEISAALLDADIEGHAIDIGFHLIENILAKWTTEDRSDPDRMPHLAALIIASAYDIAIHDAYGKIHDVDVYETYGPPYMNHDLAHYLVPHESWEQSPVSFEGKFIAEFLDPHPPVRIPVWHLVGGLDPIDSSQVTDAMPRDDYPVALADWIDRDGLTHLKIKLRGNDAEWDFERTVAVGGLLRSRGGGMLSTDFNCTVHDPDYVIQILDRLKTRRPEIFEMIRYVEQPFPYDLQAHQIDVHAVSRRRDLFLDESAHDWRYVALGKRLGWTGVALKTCKTQTGALLSLCWARASGMPLMVQDLTNPMLAQIPHVRLAAAAGTIAGVESNAMQFYPDASLPESAIHPGLYRRRGGLLDLSSISGPGFGYRIEEIDRDLPAKAF